MKLIYPFPVLFSSYAAKAKITSDRYKDQMNTPLQTAVHWVKHVAKNKGAPHMRSAAVDLPFYVYYNMDVYFALLVIVYLLVAAIKKAIGGSMNITIGTKCKTQ